VTSEPAECCECFQPDSRWCSLWRPLWSSTKLLLLMEWMWKLFCRTM